MKRINDIILKSTNKIKKHSLFVFMLLTFINVLIFIYLLVLVTHPTPEMVNVTVSFISISITGIGFYLVYVNLKSINEVNNQNKSNVIYDYYLKRIDFLSKEVESYEFCKYILFDEIKLEPVKGLLRFEPVLRIYFTALQENSLYKSDSDDLTNIYYSEKIKQKPYKICIDDLKRLKDDLLDLTHKGYYLIIQINSRQDLSEDLKELLYSEIIRRIMPGYIDICYNFSYVNNIIFPNRASKVQPSNYFNAFFYDNFLAIISSKILTSIMLDDLQIIIEEPRIDEIRKSLKERKMFRTRFAFLPE